MYEAEILKRLEEDRHFLKFYGIFKKNEMEYVIATSSGDIDLHSAMELRKNDKKKTIISTKSLIFFELSAIDMIFWKKQNRPLDVKPQNVIIKMNRKLSDFCIGDFKNSLLLQNEEKMINCSELCGFSPKYAAPEIKLIQEF